MIVDSCFTGDDFAVYVSNCIVQHVLLNTSLFVPIFVPVVEVRKMDVCEGVRKNIVELAEFK